jgi:hypothetical protein
MCVDGCLHTNIWQAFLQRVVVCSVSDGECFTHLQGAPFVYLQCHIYTFKSFAAIAYIYTFYIADDVLTLCLYSLCYDLPEEGKHSPKHIAELVCVCVCVCVCVYVKINCDRSTFYVL